MTDFFTLDRCLEIAGFLLGVLYLWWEYHPDRRMWIAGLIMPAISMTVYYTKGLYADFAMNIYYLLMAVYGFTAWGRRHKHSGGKALPIRHISASVALRTAAVFVPVYAALALWLIYGTDSTVPYADAFTTAGSIIGTWLLARKYIEQWWVWTAVDAVCVALYIYKGIYFYSGLYAIYTVVAVFGYFKWRRLMGAQPTLQRP